MTFQVHGLLLPSVENETCLCFLSRGGQLQGSPAWVSAASRPSALPGQMLLLTH